MPHFSTTQRITTGGRLGHDRIGLLCYVHIIKKTVNIGIYTINRLALSSSGILYLSTINSFLNTENGSVFFNTLINNVHVYTLTIYYP